jgi:haloacetate dehalogenase
VFDGFALDYVDVGDVTLRVRHGGRGAAVVLMHGHPRTHTTWHRVAPQLAESFFVVCPDLRGYGESTLPPDAPEHAQSAKGAMASDMVALMREFGHERFAVVGHDRGGLVAFRTALDHPGVVDRLVVMDALPVVEHLERLNETFVRTWWHWWFLGQTDKPAEQFIDSDPDRWYRLAPPEVMGQENHDDVRRCLRNPQVVHGMCEDYRAGLRIDRREEQAARAAGRQVQCPTLLLAATEDDIDVHGDPAEIWRTWVAGELQSAPIHSGHHQAEEAPDEVTDALLGFLAPASDQHAAG